MFWSAPALLTAIAPLATESVVTAWTGFELLALGVFVFNTLAAIECWRPNGPRLQNHVVLAVTWQAGGVTAEHAAVVAERIAHAIRTVAIDTGQGAIRPTASIGTMSCLAAESDLSGLMRNADVALYRAKDSGRDRVMPFKLAA